MTIDETLRAAADYLRDAGIESARIDAELLLGHVLQMSRVEMLAHSTDAVDESPAAAMRSLLERRGRDREPVPYLIGHTEFYGLPFLVNAGVLIPRPSTETLVGIAVERLGAGGLAADIGTGSGAIAVSIARLTPARVVATDISDAALAVAASNALLHGVEARVRFLRGDLLEPLAGAAEPFDLIASNPPYIAADELGSLMPELRHEPREALCDEADGYRLLKTLVEGAPRFLRPGGALLLEVGVKQAGPVRQLALYHGAYGDVKVWKDLDGIDRVIEATHK